MKKNNILSVLMFLFVSMSSSLANASGKLIEVERSIESESLQIKISKDLTGVFTGRVCQRCELQVLKITPATQFIVGRKKVALKFASDYSGKPGVVSFDIKTRLVTRIRSY